MVLTKRERSIIVVMIVAIMILGLDRYVLAPLLDRRSQLAVDIEAAERQSQKADRLLKNNERMKRKWKDMIAAGLKSDASSAENQLLHAVRDWEQDAGLTFSLLKPERTERDKQFQRIVFRATGTGTMYATSRFLWRVRTAMIPVRIDDLQISSRKDGVDDLNIQMGISTLCLNQEQAKPSGTKEQTP